MQQLSKEDAKKFEKDLKRQRSKGGFKKMVVSIIGLVAVYFLYKYLIAK